MVETETPRHDHKPSGELAAAVGNICTEAPQVVLAQLLEHERVSVHRRVVTAADETSDVNEERTIASDEPCPGLVARWCVARTEQARQFSRESIGHRSAPLC